MRGRRNSKPRMRYNSIFGLPAAKSSFGISRYQTPPRSHCPRSNLPLLNTVGKTCRHRFWSQCVSNMSSADQNVLGVHAGLPQAAMNLTGQNMETTRTQFVLEVKD